MPKTKKRSTIYFKSDIHKALRVKAASCNKSVSELVNEAVHYSLIEDQEDISAFKVRENEPTITYESLLNDLKKHGRI